MTHLVASPNLRVGSRKGLIHPRPGISESRAQGVGGSINSFCRIPAESTQRDCAMGDDGKSMPDFSEAEEQSGFLKDSPSFGYAADVVHLRRNVRCYVRALLRKLSVAVLVDRHWSLPLLQRQTNLEWRKLVPSSPFVGIRPFAKRDGICGEKVAEVGDLPQGSRQRDGLVVKARSCQRKGAHGIAATPPDKVLRSVKVTPAAPPAGTGSIQQREQGSKLLVHLPSQVLLRSLLAL